MWAPTTFALGVTNLGEYSTTHEISHSLTRHSTKAINKSKHSEALIGRFQKSVIVLFSRNS